MIFETNDLIIRPSEWEDIDDFYQWEQKPEVTEFFSIKDGQTKEDVIRKYIADDENPQAEQFTILLKRVKQNLKESAVSFLAILRTAGKLKSGVFTSPTLPSAAKATASRPWKR